MATAKDPKFEVEWFQGPLPPTRRSYGVHLNIGAHKGEEKITYGNGTLAIIRDVANLNNIQIFNEHKAKVNVVMFAPNGNWVASGDESGVVHVWGYPNMIIKNTARVGQCVNDLRWSSDSKRIIAAGNGHSEFAKAFPFDSSNPLGKVDRITKTALSCDWSPTLPHRVAVADEDKTVNFYHGVPFKYDSRTLKHTNFPNVVRYAPSGKYFATVGSDGKTFIYDGKTGEVVKSLEDEGNNHTGGIFGLAWSPDSTELVTASADRTIKIWNVEDSKVVHTWEVNSNSLTDVDDQQSGIMWSASNKIISISLSGFLSFWDREKADPVNMLKGHNQPITAYAYSRATGVGYTGDVLGRVCTWDAATGAVDTFNGDGGKGISALAVSNDGKQLLSASLNNIVYLNDAASRTFNTTPLVTTKTQVKGLAFNSDGGKIAIATSNGDVSLIVDGAVTSTVNVKEALQVVFAADDSELYVTTGTQKVLAVISVNGTDLALKTKSPDEFQQHAHVVAANDRYVVSNQHNEILIWKEDFSAPRTYGWSYHNARITDMKWSPNNKNLVTVSADRQLIIWLDFETLKPRNFIIPDLHPGGYFGVDWINDTTLMTIAADGTMKRVKVTAELSQ